MPPPARKAEYGIVLAGGTARRMGGGDKALIELAGRPLLTQVIDALAPQCGRIILSANGDPERFHSFGLAVAPDTAGAGPLAGILAGLDRAAELGGTEDFHALVVPTDCPLLPADLAARLFAVMVSRNAEIALAASDGRTHPVVGLWRASLRHDLRRALSVEGVRKVDAFTAERRTAVAEWPTAGFDPFFNVNSPDDLDTVGPLLRIGIAGSGTCSKAGKA